MTSCGTLFTSSYQYVPVLGNPQTTIYGKNDNILGKTDDDGHCEVKLKKSLNSQKLTLKKDGYKIKIVQVDAIFNPVSVINLTNVIAWAVDLGTGKCCKYDDSVINFELEQVESAKESVKE